MSSHPPIVGPAGHPDLDPDALTALLSDANGRRCVSPVRGWRRYWLGTTALCGSLARLAGDSKEDQSVVTTPPLSHATQSRAATPAQTGETDPAPGARAVSQPSPCLPHRTQPARPSAKIRDAQNGKPQPHAKRRRPDQDEPTNRGVARAAGGHRRKRGVADAPSFARRLGITAIQPHAKRCADTGRAADGLDHVRFAATQPRAKR